jgi:hypothetical protein
MGGREYGRKGVWGGYQLGGYGAQGRLVRKPEGAWGGWEFGVDPCVCVRARVCVCACVRAIGNAAGTLSPFRPMRCRYVSMSCTTPVEL